MRETPIKKGFTAALPIRYHLLAVAGRSVRERRAAATRTFGRRESKENYGKDDAIANDKGAGGGYRATQQGREILHVGVCRVGGARDQEERRRDPARHRPAGARGPPGAYGPQPGYPPRDPDSG